MRTEIWRGTTHLNLPHIGVKQAISRVSIHPDSEIRGYVRNRRGLKSLNHKDLQDLEDFRLTTELCIEFFEVLKVFVVQLSGHNTCHFLRKFRNPGSWLKIWRAERRPLPASRADCRRSCAAGAGIVIGVGLRHGFPGPGEDFGEIPIDQRVRNKIHRRRDSR